MKMNRMGLFRRFLHSPLAKSLPAMNNVTQDRETEALLRHLKREARKTEVEEESLDEARKKRQHFE